MTSKKKIAQSLSNVPLFARCSPGDLRTIARHVEVVRVDADTTLISQGDAGETFYLLLDGEVAVLRDGAEINRLGPDSHFGELALLDPQPRSATVVTTTECEVAVLSVRMFRVIVRDLPSVTFGLLGSLADQLRSALAPGQE